MTSDEKINLLKKMLADFWLGRDGSNADEMYVMLDMIGSVLEFGGDQNDG